MNFNFPAIHTKNSSEEQTIKVLEEAKEVKDELVAQDDLSRDLEMGDLLQSVETYFRIRIEERGIRYVREIIRQTEDKNRQRGYYRRRHNEVAP